MTNLNTYNFQSNDIRVVDLDGESWFVAKDVCDVLGLGTVSKAVDQHCQPHQSRHVRKSNMTKCPISFPNRGMTTASEGGLYSLIMGSTKPQAGEFKAWVTDVVLPAIRKDGAYIMGEEKVATGLLRPRLPNKKHHSTKQN